MFEYRIMSRSHPREALIPSFWSATLGTGLSSNSKVRSRSRTIVKSKFGRK